MGLLDKLWDDSLAGPCPDSGLGKLRKTTITNSAMATASAPEGKVSLRRLRERRASVQFQRLNDEAIQVTQSITIIKRPYLHSPSMDSPSSPAGLSPPISPCFLTPRERENPWRSNKYKNNVPPAAAKRKSEKSPRAEPRSPTVYDWVVFSALDG
uniref:Uncharacterized protein n=1 Tax=Picea sitchensis TaxID=3332 RepID=A9NLF6_PICSI|nr:unknown [Picea sitchensis]